MSKKWASNDRDRLLVENFKKFKTEGDFVSEEASPSKVDDDMFPTKLSSVDPDLAKVYTNTGDDSKDGGSDDDEIGVEEKPNGVAKVTDLSPSQSSMNIEKALAFVIQMLHPEGKLQPGGNLGAFISEEGLIMDGHHRWIATGMINPDLEVGGYLVQFPGKQLVAILNAMTKGRYGKMTGKAASGGFDQFQEGPIRKQLETYLQKGVWGNLKPEDVQAVIEEWTGQKGPSAVDAAVQKMVQNLSKLNLSTPSWAPERPDMPIIDKPDVGDAVSALRTGQVDVNPPYSKQTKGAFTKKGKQGSGPVAGGRLGEHKRRIKKLLKKQKS